MQRGPDVYPASQTSHRLVALTKLPIDRLVMFRYLLGLSDLIMESISSFRSSGLMAKFIKLQAVIQKRSIET